MLIEPRCNKSFANGFGILKEMCKSNSADNFDAYFLILSVQFEIIRWSNNLSKAKHVKYFLLKCVFLCYTKAVINIDLQINENMLKCVKNFKSLFLRTCLTYTQKRLCKLANLNSNMYNYAFVTHSVIIHVTVRPFAMILLVCTPSL